MFDSGVGGLTVARAVLDQLPHEALHYVGDTANGPYGPKPIADVRRHALEVMDDLVATGVKALVIACNSASAACLRDARERYDVPVIEVILPAVRRAVARHPQRPGRRDRHDRHDHQRRLRGRVRGGAAASRCPAPPARGFAEFVERGVTSGRQLLGLAESYLAPLNQRRRRHPRPRLHALPAADRPAVGRRWAGRSRWCRAPRRRPRTSTGCCPARPAAPPTTRRGAAHVFRATGPAEPFARLSRRFLGPELAQAAAADTQLGRSGRRREACDEADRARLLGQRARPGLAGVRLPGRGRRLPAAARPRQRRVRGAAALRRRCTEVDAIVLSATCTPTTAST